jgi:hypothetical protein
VNEALIRQAWARAGNRCEYSRIPHPYYRPPFQIDHIIARKHSDNLALACFHCNCHNGPNIASQDLESGEVVRLFHARKDTWRDHFQFARRGIQASGTTSDSRVAAALL